MPRSPPSTGSMAWERADDGVADGGEVAPGVCLVSLEGAPDPDTATPAQIALFGMQAFGRILKGELGAGSYEELRDYMAHAHARLESEAALLPHVLVTVPPFPDALPTIVGPFPTAAEALVSMGEVEGSLAGLGARCLILPLHPVSVLAVRRKP